MNMICDRQTDNSSKNEMFPLLYGRHNWHQQNKEYVQRLDVIHEAFRQVQV